MNVSRKPFQAQKKASHFTAQGPADIMFTLRVTSTESLQFHLVRGVPHYTLESVTVCMSAWTQSSWTLERNSDKYSLLKMEGHFFVPQQLFRRILRYELKYDLFTKYFMKNLFQCLKYFLFYVKPLDLHTIQFYEIKVADSVVFMEWIDSLIFPKSINPESSLSCPMEQFVSSPGKLNESLDTRKRVILGSFSSQNLSPRPPDGKQELRKEKSPISTCSRVKTPYSWN